MARIRLLWTGCFEKFFEQIAFSLNTLVETTDIAINDVVRVLSALASGDLTEKIEGHF